MQTTFSFKITAKNGWLGFLDIVYTTRVKNILNRSSSISSVLSDYLIIYTLFAKYRNISLAIKASGAGLQVGSFRMLETHTYTKKITS